MKIVWENWIACAFDFYDRCIITKRRWYVSKINDRVWINREFIGHELKFTILARGERFVFDNLSASYNFLTSQGLARRCYARTAA